MDRSWYLRLSEQNLAGAYPSRLLGMQHTAFQRPQKREDSPPSDRPLFLLLFRESAAQFEAFYGALQLGCHFFQLLAR